MTDLNTAVQGWKDRRELAHSKRDDRNSGDRAAIRAERERMYQAQAALGRDAALEQAKALEAETCTCTACGGTGKLTLPKAMAVIEAMHNYGFSDRVPSKMAVASLAALVRGEDTLPGHPVISFTYGSISPAPGRVGVSAETVTAPKAVASPSKVKNAKAVETTSDGFLIDTDD